MVLPWLVSVADQPLTVVPSERLPAGDAAVNLKSVRVPSPPPVEHSSVSTKPYPQSGVCDRLIPTPAHRISGAPMSLWTSGCHVFDISTKTLLGARPTCSLFPLAYMRRL